MAISAPRQRTTFKKDKKTGKVKGTTTYRAPERESADEQLDRYIRDNQNKKNQSAGIKSIVTDMPSKFAEGFDFDANNNLVNPTPGKKSKYFRKDGSLNETGKYILGVYSDERPEYSRQLNRLRTSSPEMAQAYAERFPVANFAMTMAPKFIPGIGPLFAMDQANKRKKALENVMNQKVNIPKDGFQNFVEFFKPEMNSEQAANTQVIEGEREPLISPQDMNLQKATPFVSPQDMGFLDDENIFDSEKAAIEAALAPGNIFDPVAADKQSKLNFINQVEGTNFTIESAEGRFDINEQFERSKQKQGGIIREEVNRDLSVDDTDPIPGGQFNLTSPTIDENTVPIILGGAGPDYDYGDFMVNEDLGNVIPTDNNFPEGGVSGTPVTQAGQELVFSDGSPVTKPVNTGLDMVGNKAFPNSPGSQEALDILNSNANPYFSGYPTMRFDDGGYARMSTFEKLKMMADSLG